jgi:hypothetical protein
VTRIVQTDELPDGVDALASADGKMIMIRASLDRASRKRAMREVMASIRRFPRLALLPALTMAGFRQAGRRISGATVWVTQGTTQLVTTAGDHLGGIAVAATAAVGAAVAVTAVLATASPAAGHGGDGSQPAGAGWAARGAGPRRVAHASLPADPLHYLGVYAPGVPESLGGISQFAASTGQQPNVALYYSSWNEKFKLSFAEQAAAVGATPAVQIEPFGVSLAAIAAGKYDAYLTSYADQVVAFGKAVIIGFAHEPDGSWYPWGAGAVAPQTWVAAWRHVVQVFRQAGAENVIWLWTVNSQGPDAAAVLQWWPGASYVTWIGLDGYFVRPGDSFTSVFGGALGTTAGLGKPVLIAETAVGPGTGDQSAGIANLFDGLRAHRLLGLVWFDVAQDSGQYHQDWQLAGNTPAVRAFQRDSGYLSP